MDKQTNNCTKIFCWCISNFTCILDNTWDLFVGQNVFFGLYFTFSSTIVLTKSNFWFGLAWLAFLMTRSSQQWFCMPSESTVVPPNQIQWARLLQANSNQVLWYRKSNILITPNVVQYSWQHSSPSKISSRLKKQNIDCYCAYIQ